jgi:hypothetical protein
MAVLDPCGHIAVEASPHHPGGNEPLGGPRTGRREREACSKLAHCTFPWCFGEYRSWGLRRGT